MDLSDAKVLVTGGSEGIGRATARLLVERGARVAICGRREDALREAAEETGAVPLAADVAREEEVVALVEAARRALGGYNVLINNAGVGFLAPLLETPAEQMRRLWETNVLGAMLVARESARHFVGEGGGSIVNVASTAARRGFAGGTAYAGSKFALAGMAECWRAELRASNVRVVQVNPSEVLTGFGGAAPRAPDPTRLHPEDIAHAIAGVLTLDDRGFVPEITVWATNPR